ncbi:GTA-gp10 family protein [Kordiimonas sediminis]|nr:GTA-gp10 family protein [Kordiimonas sediminis]
MPLHSTADGQTLSDTFKSTGYEQSMAIPLLGEKTLPWSDGALTLRLSIGTMMELEDHMNMGLMTALQTRFADMTIRDLVMLLLAMTGRDFRDPQLIRNVAAELPRNDIAQTMLAVAECLQANLAPQLTPLTQGDDSAAQP